jgi:hypothetical protein
MVRQVPLQRRKGTLGHHCCETGFKQWEPLYPILAQQWQTLWSIVAQKLFTTTGSKVMRNDMLIMNQLERMSDENTTYRLPFRAVIHLKAEKNANFRIESILIEIQTGTLSNAKHKRRSLHRDLMVYLAAISVVETIVSNYGMAYK